MYCTRAVTDNLFWVGADDYRIKLFENYHEIPKGVSYNAYLLLDEKTVLFDTVDWSCNRQMMENIDHLLDGRSLDYLVIHHVEPDHGASIRSVMDRYPNITLICSKMAVKFLSQFGFATDESRIEIVGEGETLRFGQHKLTFFTAPMVHWPEVLVSFDKTNGVLFTADAFGSFGTLDGKLFADEVNYERDWIDEARSYYTNIVGKFGANVQKLLKKLPVDQVKIICPLHGLVWRKDLAYFIDKHNRWSRYEPEESGVLLVWGSMYGNTQNAVSILATLLAERGITNTVMYDASRTSVTKLIAETFRFSHMVIASATCNLEVLPPVRNFVAEMQSLHVQNRTIAVMEGGTWNIRAGKLLREEIAKMSDMTLLENTITVKSSMKENQLVELEALADAIVASLN